MPASAPVMRAAMVRDAASAALTAAWGLSCLCSRLSHHGRGLSHVVLHLRLTEPDHRLACLHASPDVNGHLGDIPRDFRVQRR